MSEKKTFVFEIDSSELALRIAEACLDMRRPQDVSSKDALEQMRMIAPGHVDGFIRAAAKAAEYITECFTDRVRR